MERQRFMTVAVVFVVLLAGCSGFGPSEGSTSTADTTTQTAADATEQTTTTTTAQATTTTETDSDSSTTDSSTTTASSGSWSKPTSPNTPLQNKMEEEDREQGRIKSVEFVDKTEASGGGYSDFNLQVTADTRMGNIDPADHGSVTGEPFFLVYVDGSLDNGSRFTRTDGTLIERKQVSQKENGEYTIEVRPDSLKQSETQDGEVTIMILLMDEDKDWDDIYGVKKVTIDYSEK
ncbi:DUF7537 family lipoprotein [Haladaptatus sp. DFWS20]|uniref:DUF7537 family lipoprotein n=1 Tax=Haladaptatus sp. DFWS20 TaxID=3403467 RepID=UPI003EC0B561